MRETIPFEIRTLAADEALSYVREVETLEAEIEDLYAGDRDDPRVRRRLGQAHHRLGIALKLAGVHGHLAVAEQVAGLRADLAQGDVMAIADAVGVVRPFRAGDVHHCGDHCPDNCALDGRVPLDCDLDDLSGN